ncbi:glycosyltransferase family 4 protein [Bordetella petrii]|uniref:Glycosyltransferase n=1 Tax=Bordetella petrii (strain ATCC BAA-461 / DSM 12804 / CCUG 43448 / CIP 107267 / Se-1111R) TaxID=340100 RepID=A9IHB9_BORPD|nr:glycosyltransferase family 4 protein [Bordetella petrii]CAP45184.1 glycosyltransferase [Bordetella petrii]
MSNSLRIGMVLDTAGRTFPPDIRVEKEAKALDQAGHQVSILTLCDDSDAPERSLLEGTKSVTVFRKKVNIRRGRLVQLFCAVSMRFPWWDSVLRDFIRTENPQVLHVHDLLMVPTVLKIAKEFGLPVVADLHENLPAAHRAYRSQYSTLLRWYQGLKWNYALMKLHEARALRQCARILIVVPEAKERLLQYGIPEERIEVVSNTEDRTTFAFDPASADECITDQYKGDWVASYIGGIGPHRGLDTVLGALPEILSRVPKFKLLIVGASDRVRQVIEAHAKRLQVSDAVDVVGWQPFSRVNSYVMASNVCLVPHRNFEHTQTTVPHKLFQYMICAKPVLVSSCRPLARIVEDSGAGRIFEADNAHSLAKEMIWMYENPTACESMGRAGQEAALGKFSWHHDAARLCAMYAYFDSEARQFSPN